MLYNILKHAWSIFPLLFMYYMNVFTKPGRMPIVHKNVS